MEISLQKFSVWVWKFRLQKGQQLSGRWRLETRIIMIDLEKVLTQSCVYLQLYQYKVQVLWLQTPTATKDQGASKWVSKQAGEGSPPLPMHCTSVTITAGRSKLTAKTELKDSPAAGNGHPVLVADWSLPEVNPRNRQHRHEVVSTISLCSHCYATVLANTDTGVSPPFFFSLEAS